MNDRNAVMRSLFWKDAKTVLPLMIMAGVGVLLFNAFAFAGSLISYGGPRADGFIMIWVLMPNLVALGAPALLVGGEEESGTLAWLRTLPIRWQSIVDVKFVVAAIAVLVAWVIASLVLAIILAADAFPPFSDYDELISSWGIIKLLFFSALLLTVSFVCAYAFRSPITALLALVPLITVVYVAAVSVAEFLLHEEHVMRFFGAEDDYMAAVPTSMWITLFCLAIGLLVALWIIQRLLGRRRLTQPSGASRLRHFVQSESQSAYRPPMMSNRQRPSAARSLHWQQFRQIRWPMAALVTIAAAGVLFLRVGNDLGMPGLALEAFAPLGIVIGAIGLGSLVFYGDTVNHRKAFFADRGISPNQVWWTRIALPLVGCLLLSALCIALLSTNSRMPHSSMFLVVLFCFAAGQAVSMSVSRPVLGIFGAPVFLVLCMIPLQMFFSNYGGYGWVAILFVPILIFATWWLCSRWIAGVTGKAFYARMLGISVFAVVLPMICVLGHRIATTPALNSAWRAKAMSASLGMDDLVSGSIHGYWHGEYYGAYKWGRDSGVFDLERNFESLDQLRRSIRAEMSPTDEIERSITNDDIAMIFDPQRVAWEMSSQELVELRYATMKLVLWRIEGVRKAATQNQADLDDLQALAEIPERSAVGLLSSRPRMFGDKAAVAKLVDMIASAELRRDSRIKALLGEWRRYQPDHPRATKVSTGIELPRTFGGLQLSRPGVLGIEQRRSDRYLDEFVRVTWEQLQRGLPLAGTAEFIRRNELWEQAHTIRYARPWGSNAFRGWSQEHENSIQQLRDQPTEPDESELSGISVPDLAVPVPRQP